MHWWWVLVSAVVVATAAPRLIRRHRRRAQVDRVRAQLSTWLPALNQPDDRPIFSGGGPPPTSSSADTPRTVVRRQLTVMPGDLAPSITVRPRDAA